MALYMRPIHARLRIVARYFDISGYKAVLSVRYAYRFDIGGMLMRICQFTTTIGSISMMTLAGYSAFQAGTVASTIALALFLISPQISRVIDVRGQGPIVPYATLVSLAGLVLMILTVSLNWHIAICYVGALLAGCMPNAPSLVRTRWTYLIQTGRLGDNGPDIKTVYSYEGVLDDISFMIGPAMAIALNTAISPVAGMIVMALMLAAGAALLASAKKSDPGGAWRSTQPDAQADADETQGMKRRSMFLSSGPVRLLFLTSLLMGTFYGMLNATEVSFTTGLGYPEAASIALIVCSIISAVVGVVFGTLKINAPLNRQFIVIGLLFGLSYTSMALITSIPALWAVSWTAVFFYAPFLITSNSMCEAHVPEERLTESLTWLSSGISLGMAFGPSLAGMLIDTVSVHAGFIGGGVAAGLLALVVLTSTLLWRRHPCPAASANASASPAPF